MLNFKNDILTMSRQNKIGELSPWFKNQLDKLCLSGAFMSRDNVKKLGDSLIDGLVSYREKNKIDTVVIGMSGGIDSALTATLFNKAGWKVHGLVLPILQNPEETKRGWEACSVCNAATEYDLTELYLSWVSNTTAQIDPGLKSDTKDALIRKGNARARLRMLTLYNYASKVSGLVGSTDNFSELSAGFWTLHGDVGDLAPIQTLWKSWEVPALSQMVGVSKSIVEATPTDGLGISNGDEDQFGCSYLEWDIMLMALIAGDKVEGDERAMAVKEKILGRVKRSAFKRRNPTNIVSELAPKRLEELTVFDKELSEEK